MHSVIELTEATVIETIRQVGYILGALIGAGFLANGILSHRAKKSADAAHKELIPNHGSSQRDAVNRVEKKLDEFATIQQQLVAGQADLGKKQDELSRADDKLSDRLDSHIDQSERILGALIRKETS